MAVLVTLGSEDVAIKACNPSPPARGDVQIADRRLNVWRNAVPIKLRIKVYQIGRRRITELPIHTDFFKFVPQRIDLAQIMRIAELPDEIGGTRQQAFFSICIVGAGGYWKTREFDGAGNPLGIDQLLAAMRSSTYSFDRST
jgi:hypothetical protein